MRQLGCNLTDTAIRKIEGGSRDVSLEEALTLAAALGVAPVHLVFPIDEPATRLFDVPGAYRYAALQWAIGNRPLGAFGWAANSPDQAAMAEVFRTVQTLFPKDPIFDEWRPVSERVARKNHVYQLGKNLLHELGLDIYDAEAASRRPRGPRDPGGQDDLDSIRQMRLKRLQVRLHSFVEEMRLYPDDAGAAAPAPAGPPAAEGP